MDEQDRSVNKALIDVQKALKTEDDLKSVVTLNQHMSSYDDTIISLYSIGKSSP